MFAECHTTAATAAAAAGPSSSTWRIADVMRLTVRAETPAMRPSIGTRVSNQVLDRTTTSDGVRQLFVTNGAFRSRSNDITDDATDTTDVRKTAIRRVQASTHTTTNVTPWLTVGHTWELWPAVWYALPHNTSKCPHLQASSETHLYTDTTLATSFSAFLDHTTLYKWSYWYYYYYY